MNMTKEQVQVAIAAGLALTNPESEFMIPVKHAGGVVILHQLLLGIGSGQLSISATPRPEAPPEAPPQPTHKKTARKKASKRKRTVKPAPKGRRNKK